MNCNINWKSYFDQIYCLFYTKQKERFDYIDNELDRVGIKDSGIFRYFYNTDNPFYFNIQQTCKKSPKYKQLDYLGCFNPYYGHFIMMLEAYQLGYNKVLFLESDALFMRDIEKMKSILDKMPSDMDMVLFDRSIKYQNLEDQKKTNEFYSKFNYSNGQYCLFTAVGMSNRFIGKMLEMQYSEFGATDDVWNTEDAKINSMNRYITFDHIVIQKEFNRRASSIQSFTETIYKRDKVNIYDFDL